MPLIVIVVITGYGYLGVSHSRFCPSCGIKLQKVLATKAEVMCIDVKHRHMVFTIPEEYREYIRKDRDALNILFIASIA